MSSQRQPPANNAEATAKANDDASTSIQNVDAKPPPFIHACQICDGCETTPIIGKCFRATSLEDYDLCEQCMADYHGKETFEEFEWEYCRPFQDQWYSDYHHFGRLLVPFLNFQHWVQCVNGGQKTTLRQQFELATHLYIQAWNITDPNEIPNVNNVITMVEQTPIDDLNSLVSWTGIHLGWFLNVFCQSTYMVRLIEFGCEAWFVRKVCVIEMIRRVQNHYQRIESYETELLLSGTFVDHIDTVIDGWGLGRGSSAVAQKPTTFISYTGAYTMEHVVQVLSNLDPEEYIWMDIFCVNQFAWTGKGRSAEMTRFRDNFMADLQKQIQNIGRTALILQKWDNVMITLGQIWVLWEIFNTANTHIRFEVLLSPRQVNDFISSCLEHTDKFEEIQGSLASIDAKKAYYEDDIDRRLILKRMQEFGLQNVNAMVIKVMREWLAREGQNYLQRQRSTAEGPSNLVLDRVGTLLQVQGKFQDAEPLLREAFERQRDQLGRDHVETLSAMGNLGLLLKSQGKLGEAELLLREAMEGMRDSGDAEIVNKISSINNLASLYHDQRNLDAAEILYRESLHQCRHELGDDHKFTLGCLSNFGMLLVERGEDMVEAKSLLAEAAKGLRQTLGDRHMDTLVALNNLAGVLREQNKLSHAEDLLREVLDGSTEQLGDEHPHTLTCMNNLAEVLRAKGELDDAELLFREALLERRRQLGDCHTDTVESMYSLAMLLFERHDDSSTNESRRNDETMQEARMLLRKAFEIARITLGDDHPHTRVFAAECRDRIGPSLGK